MSDTPGRPEGRTGEHEAADGVLAWVNAVRIEDADPHSDAVLDTVRSGGEFRTIVEHLRELGSPHLRELGDYALQVFHHGHVKMAVGPGIRSLQFASVYLGSATRAMVLCPALWTETVKEEPLAQFGAVISMASQAADYYNGRTAPRGGACDEPRTVVERARSYESEFLAMLRPGLLDDRQRRILMDHPGGFNTAYSYARIPVVGREKA